MFIFLSPVPLLRSAAASLWHSESRSFVPHFLPFLLILGKGDQAHREPVNPVEVGDAATVRVEDEVVGVV